MRLGIGNESRRGVTEGAMVVCGTTVFGRVEVETEGCSLENCRVNGCYYLLIQ